MDSTRPHPNRPKSPTGRYVILFPPDKMTAIERRVADVIRCGLRVREDSPPGIYLATGRADGKGDEIRIVVKREAGSEVPESTTAVDSIVSESTIFGTPSPSKVPFEIADDAATKFSEPICRVELELDRPQILGSYAHLTYTDTVIEKMTYVREKGALYCLQIAIQYSQGHPMSFNAQADTGANNAWLFHEQVRQLIDIKDDWSPGADKPCTITLIPKTTRPPTRPALPMSYMPSCLATKIDAGTPSGTPVDTDSYFHYPRIFYGSGGRRLVVVGPMRSPIDFKINNAHNWLTYGPDKKDALEARFSFAICDAATADFFGDLRVDGLIGFGPEVNMSVFKPPYRHEQDFGVRDYPSFSTGLIPFLPNVDEEGGIVLYWYLKPPGSRSGPSFLAFNKFPEHLLRQRISWTAPILIGSIPDAKSKAWIITIRQLKILLVADKEYNERHARSHEDQEVLIDFGEGEKFCVDTGFSTTTFPPEAMFAINSEFDTSGRTYAVPEWVDLKASTVEYTFVSGSELQGTAGEVVFVTQAHHFVWDEDGQGLIWLTGSDETKTSIRCILGLNFFHSAVVAMHRPEPDIGEPYLRFGPMIERDTEAAP